VSPHPAVVVNHGSGLEQDSKPGVARLLTDAGYLVFVPFRRGYAGSPGQPRTDAVTAQPGDAGYGDQVARRLIAENDDVLAARRFVRARPDVVSPSAALAGRCAARAHPYARRLFPPFGATEMEAHQIWIHAPHLWVPVVLPKLQEWVSGLRG
jgi:dienelactone hydrolase